MTVSRSGGGKLLTSIVKEEDLIDRDVRVILYYGYGGPGECVSHNMNGYAETHYAIDWALDKASSNRQLASAAYKKLYTDQADKSVGDTITAYAGSSGVAGTQELIYYKYTPKPEYGYLYLAKRGATTHDVLLGAEYYVYKNASCTSYANDKNGNHTLRVNSENSPYSNRLTYEPGTYYVRESSKVPKGTRRDTAVYKVTVKAGQSSWVSSKGWNEDIEYGVARIDPGRCRLLWNGTCKQSVCVRLFPLRMYYRSYERRLYRRRSAGSPVVPEEKRYCYGLYHNGT